MQIILLSQTTLSYHTYTDILLKKMKSSKGKIIMSLEGGYNLNSLANSIAASVCIKQRSSWLPLRLAYLSD
ncbi:hypothetical protein L1987_59338 [Smallanthus sonchifolius]|uniref:Uncharacterized protein n=1 Tax=Smallanthus sonchifolius TaxID=185202 RepID=A0ACB9D505_9ASTR|nr:hypothetical protein L1987_59338 [Smallanthus sonchifolius]